MKKLIFSGLIALLFGMVIIGCEKELIGVDHNSDVQSYNYNDDFRITLSELQGIIASKNVANRRNGWWQNFTRWIKAHSGASQIYINGEPLCSGNYNCGPCPGFCPIANSIFEGNDDGSISSEDLLSGLRPAMFAIYANSQDSNEVVLVIEIPTEYEGDFISDDVFRLPSNFELPEFFTSEAGFSSITALQGNYPVVRESSEGITYTIVDISVD